MEESGRYLVRYYPGICLDGLRKITKTLSTTDGLQAGI
jgi:hypothetical protein